MLRALVAFSIRFPAIVLLAAMALVGYGIWTLTAIRLDVFPEFSPNVVVVQAEAPGLPAELVETQVTQRIEAVLAGASGLAVLRSQSIPGLSVVSAQFDEATPILRNRQAVAERLAALAGQLPAGTQLPRITPLTSSTSTTLGIGVTSERRTPMELRTLVDTVLRPHLMSAPGVADINVFGGEVRQWQVRLDPDRLARHGLATGDVLAALRGGTLVRGAGQIENDNQRIAIAISSQPMQPLDLERQPVRVGPAGVVTVGDVASVAIGAAPALSGAAINGAPGVLLLAQAQFGSSIPQVTAALERAVEDVRPVFEREGARLDARLFRPANFIEVAIGNVRADVLIGSVLVLAVLFLFLFNVRTALISAAAIPLSLLAAIIVLHHAGIGLNIMAIAGLAIALGEVVDDAIIDMENIFRRLRERQAAGSPVTVERVVFDASLEVRASVLYATFIVALVFYPLLTLSGVAGKLFFSLGLAYILAILASLVVAMTVTPAMCLLLLGRWPRPVTARDPPAIGWLLPRYRRLLERLQRRPRGVIFAAAALVTAAGAVVPLFSGEFLPPLKEGHFIVHLAAAPGTSAHEALRVGRRVAERIGAIDGVVSTAQWIGRAPGGPDTAGIHYSEMHVELGRKSSSEQDHILAAIRSVLTDEQRGIVGLSFGVNTFLAERIGETVSGYAFPLVINLHGTDIDSIDRDANRVAAAIARVPGIHDVQVQSPTGTPKLAIRLLPDRLRRHGVTAAAAIEAVAVAYDGAPVGVVYEGTQATPAVLWLDPAARRYPPQVGQLMVRADDGRLVALAELATLAVEAGHYRVLRLDGKRVQTVTAAVRGRDLDDLEGDIRGLLAEAVPMSAGTYAVVGGTAGARALARDELLVHGALATLGIFALLYMALASVRHVVITFLNLPFALLGGGIAVTLAGGWVSVGSMVGFVTLFGITLRNSIMLLSHCRHLVEVEGRPWSVATATQAACERLPSILMTAIVTALALLPLAINAGEAGREIEGPMANVIVGGLLTSTILNLLVLPVVLARYADFRPRIADPLAR